MEQNLFRKADIVTVKEMKEIERQADETGLSYYQMMENAGTASYMLMKSKYSSVKSLLVFCGKGNNGGDGLVVARLAANDGIAVQVILVEGFSATEDAKTNFKRLPHSVVITEIKDTDEKYLERINDIIPDCSSSSDTVIIDALYGTGFHGELKESGRIACDMMNLLKAPIISLDIPSGCSADDGCVSCGAVKADITVVFHAYKKVHLPPIINCGQCILVSIGIEKIM